MVLASTLLNPHLQSGALAQDACPDDFDATPTEVTVEAVPIVVTSTTDDYFVLYATFELFGATRLVPVQIKRGEAGTTTLSQNVGPLSPERYRVEKYQIADPGDADGDCIDDLTELAEFGRLNPLNHAPAIAPELGALGISDLASFGTLANLNHGKSYINYVLIDVKSQPPAVFFTNTKTYPSYVDFLARIGRHSDPETRAGSLTYDADLRAPNGTQGIFYFSVGPYTQFLSLARATHSLLAAHMPLLTDNLAWHIENGRLRSLQSELEALRESPINLVFDNDLQLGRVVAVPNTGTSFGRLVVAHPNSRPDARDIVIYLSLPDVLPQVAGAILALPQPALSPLARQARQDSIPLAYADDPLGDPRVGSLLGQPVKFVVSEYGWELFAATTEEVDAHYDSLPPPPDQTPIRDLARTAIAALTEIGFDDWPAFGVKAANLGELAELGLPDGTVPSGFAIPISFYDEFMKAHGFYGRIEQMLGDSGFQASEDTQAQRLTELRTSILAAQSPSWIVEALNAMYAQLPQDRAISYRSSSNAPAWPDFGGARNQDSYVQDPGAIEVDGIDRPMKQLFASHWSFDAFRERELHGIDHLASAVAVLVHASHSDASASGAAVSLDPISDRPGTYYVNAQPGAQWDTQSAVHSVPEALLIDPENGAHILTTSGLLQPGTLLLDEAHLQKLYQHLEVIHDHFEGLYHPAPGQPFAMEIEFTITSENILVIKQTRPWVFGEGAAEPTTQLATQRATPPVQSAAGGGGGGGGGPNGPTPSQADFEWTVKYDIEALDGHHRTPTGMWSDGTVLWLLHNPDGAGDTIYAYDFESGERVEAREFALDERNRAPRGVWSDGKGTAWVSDSGRDLLFAYDVTTGERREDRDIELAGRNGDARGIWSDDETMWVLDERRNAAFAYDLESGALLAEYALDSANGSPRGVWSDGVSLWVSDPGSSPRRLFAYRLPTREEVAAADEDVSLERVRDEDFTHLSSSSNNSPRGIWADGDFMYVADASDDKVYTYNMPDAIDARLASLTLSGIDIGEFDPDRTDYQGVIREGVTETTVEAGAVQHRTAVSVEPDDSDGNTANGHQVVLDGLTEITITVMSADRSRTKTYRVTFEPRTTELALGPTWTSFEWPGADGVAIAEAGVPEEVVVIYAWDEPTGSWLGYFPGLEGAPGFNTLTRFSSGATYWVAAMEAVTWTLAGTGAGRE